MQAKILSLHCGGPENLAWNGKSISTSMARPAVPGPLVVHQLYIEGDKFASPEFHGKEYGVLYAFGMESALLFAKELGRDTYVPGTTGENVCLDKLDESKISVGDVFEFGEVLAQAVYPRIPCGKLNFRLQHADAQKAMQRCGRSGVYFRVLRPGKIFADSAVKRVERSKHPFNLAELYRKMVARVSLDEQEMRIAVANGAFPRHVHEKWVADLAELAK